MRGKVAIITGVALIVVVVGVVFALPPVTQRFPRVMRPIAVHTLCDEVSLNGDAPAVGEEAVLSFDCPGSAPDCTFNLGHDCAFTVGNGNGGQQGFATPTFTLPTGYVHIWVMGSGREAGDCSAFDDSGHWLTSGTKVLLGNISHTYCAHVDAGTGDLATFDVVWT